MKDNVKKCNREFFLYTIYHDMWYLAGTNLQIIIFING